MYFPLEERWGKILESNKVKAEDVEVHKCCESKASSN